MFPLSVAGNVNVAPLRPERLPGVWRSLVARIEEHGGTVVSSDAHGLRFSNPILSSALRSNWSLFTGVTGGSIQLIENDRAMTFRYCLSLRRAAIAAALLLLAASTSGQPAILLAVALLVAIQWTYSATRLSGAFLRWLREAPGVFLAPPNP